ncbi:MAG: T9SS type A sorting domain-containing protein, partial [Ignavibacterium sp.]
ARIVKTTDAGNSWYVVNRTGLTDTIGLINRFFFINPTTGWAVTTRGGILKTTDAGENWFAQLNAGANVIFQSIHFVDSLYGWTAGGRPYKTTDGGDSWVQQTNTTIWNSDDVYFQDINTGWFGKYSSINNSLFKTTDSGINWDPILEVTGARKFYFFPDPIHWFIIGFSRYYITNNFGNSWLEFTEEVPTGLVSFSAPNDKLGYFVGNLGLILRYDDTTYVPVELTSFAANVNGNNIILNWSTASELNNKGFEIERSTNKTEWEIIDFIEGNGTTTEISNYTFTDNLYENNSQKLFYRLKQIDFDGTFEYSNILEVEVGTPSEFFLSQNYPNPFNPETKIDYRISEETFVNISLYDVTGRKIKELFNEKKQPGYYTIKLKGGELSSGIYFYRLTTTSGYTAVKKLTIIK